MFPTGFAIFFSPFLSNRFHASTKQAIFYEKFKKKSFGRKEGKKPMSPLIAFINSEYNFKIPDYR